MRSIKILKYFQQSHFGYNFQDSGFISIAVMTFMYLYVMCLLVINNRTLTMIDLGLLDGSSPNVPDAVNTAISVAIFQFVSECQ